MEGALMNIICKPIQSETTQFISKIMLEIYLAPSW